MLVPGGRWGRAERWPEEEEEEEEEEWGGGKVGKGNEATLLPLTVPSEKDIRCCGEVEECVYVCVLCESSGGGGVRS